SEEQRVRVISKEDAGPPAARPIPAKKRPAARRTDSRRRGGSSLPLAAAPWLCEDVPAFGKSPSESPGGERRSLTQTPHSPSAEQSVPSRVTLDTKAEFIHILPCVDGVWSVPFATLTPRTPSPPGGRVRAPLYHARLPHAPGPGRARNVFPPTRPDHAEVPRVALFFRRKGVALWPARGRDRHRPPRPPADSPPPRLEILGYRHVR